MNERNLDVEVQELLKFKQLIPVESKRSVNEISKVISSHVHINEVNRAKGLLKNEKEMLKNLLECGNYVPSCWYNKQGHIELLNLGVYGNISESIYFPFLYSLDIFFPNYMDINFILKHRSSINSLSLHLKNRKVPILSELSELKMLKLTYNNIKEISGFGDLGKLESLNLSHNNINSLISLETRGHVRHGRYN